MTTRIPAPANAAAVTEVRLGHGHTAPDRATAAAVPTAPAAPRPTGLGGRLLAAAALLSPLAFGLQYVVDTSTLPREDPAVYLGGLAEAPGRSTLALCVYLVAVACIVPLALVLVRACRDSSRRLAPIAATVTMLGALAGAGFAGVRLVALSLVADGEVPAYGDAAWTAMQEGAAFAVLSPLLLCAILGAFLATAVMVRARRDLGWWVAPTYLLGFVLASGEFPDVVSLVGGVVQAVALVPVARRALRG